MRAAYDEAGWEPSSVDLIECHATGTPLGDAVEYRSLRQLWSGMTRPAGRAKAVIGSVKSNLGHLLTGAGAAGLAKVILALEQETLPPTANFRSPGEALESYENGPLQVLSEAQPWSAAENHPRRAAVSAFGFGGINAHVLVEAPSGLTSDASEINGPTEVLLRDDPIAFVGMDASFAGSETLEALRHRIFQGDLPEPKPLARGAFSKRAESLWRARQTSPRGPLRGYAFESIEVPLGRYRIPPVELTESLAQQTLMLRCAAEAWERAGLKSLSADDRLRVGVFIGLGLDLHTGDFQLRWSLAERAEDWARRLGHHDPAAFRARILEKLGPALSATRTVGALGGIVASRIARELNLGGPSLTISARAGLGLAGLGDRRQAAPARRASGRTGRRG
jgi:acyl transferase domain-containing protein